MKASTVIIGGGVMGVSIAMHAARRSGPRDAPVVLLERSALAAGSSGRSGAILRQFYAAPQLAGMARDSLAVYASFARRTGRSLGFQRSGVLTLAPSRAPEAIAELERIVRSMADLGIDVRRVDAHEIRRLAPALAVEDGTVGAFEPGGGFVDPRATVEAFAALARTYGAVLRPGQEVLDIRFWGGRACGVETEDERIDCERVVVAAGPWTKRLLARHGVELPLGLLCTEQHFVATPGEEDPRERAGAGLDEEHEESADPPILAERFAVAAEPGPPLHPVLLDQELGFYTRCEPRQRRTRVGRLDHAGERELDDPDACPSAVDPDFVRWARARLARRLPAYAGASDLPSETALYTMSPDGQALIGPIADRPGLFVVSGFSGHGFKLAPSVGEGVAAMLAGEPVSAFDASFFSPARFAAGKAHASPRAFGM